MSTHTTPSTNGGWKPRKAEKLTCPSGQVVHVKRPGPEFTIHAGTVHRTFTKTKGEKPEGQSAEEYGLDVITKLNDEELAAVMNFARELVCAIMVSPRLVHHPCPDSDEIGPDDIGDDFWWLFNHAMINFFGFKIPVGDTEVEVSDLETFRRESGISGDSVDSAHIPVAESEREAADQGLGSSAGT